MDGAEASPEDLLSSLDWIRGLVRSLVADPGAAEDVAQEAWLLAASQPRASRAWIAVVARNLVRQRGRSERSRQRREQSVAQQEAQASTADLVLRTERQALVVRAVTELPDPYRTVVVMRFVDGLTPAQIAGRLGVAPGTIRSQLKRGLERLRADLDAQFGSREAWGLALLPLAEPPLAAAAALGPIGLAATTGWMMKKTMVLVLVCLAIAAGTYSFLGAGNGPMEAPNRAATNVAALADPSAATGGPALAGTNEPDRDLRTAFAAPTDSPADQPASEAAGWWLTGRADVPGPLDASLTKIAIYAIGADPMHAAAGSDGSVDVDLSSIFRHPTLLCTSFQVRLDHPGCLPKTLILRADSADRQEAFLPGVRVEFPLEVRLEAAAHGVSGRMELPGGASADDLQAALLSRQGDKWQVVDQTDVGADRTYRLRAGEAGEYVVIGWHEWSRKDANLDRPRPAQASVSLDGYQTGVDLVFEWGEAIEGRVICPPLLPDMRWTVDCTMIETERFPITGLACAGDRVEYSACEARVGHDGQFRVAGLGPHSYLVRVSRAIWEGCAQGTIWGGSVSPIFPAQAPATGLSLDLGVGTLGFEVLANGQPLEGAEAIAGYANGSSSQSLASDGRVLILLGGDRPVEWVRFSCTGYGSQTVQVDSPDLDPATWNPVELQPARNGQLVVVIEEDPDRSIEGLTVDLTPVDWEHESELEDAEYEGRRITDSVTFPGIPPGSYQARINPQTPLLSQTTDVQLTRVHEVVIAPDESTTVRVSFAEGGLVRLHLDELPGSSDPFFQLFGPSGERVDVYTTVTSQVSSSSSGTKLLRRGPNALEPALPPGLYRLELWADDLPQRTVSIEVLAGETTRVELK